MQTNLSVWDYYPRDNSYFIDPMYVPYMETTCDIGNDCPTNKFKKQGYKDGFVNPGLVRKGWCQSFQLLHPNFPCPEGWTKGKDGWCARNEPEFGDNGLYTKDAFVPKYQYWDGYAPRYANSKIKQINEFDNRSVNPFTGDYVIYHHPKPATQRSKYGALPSKDSYLA